jgi:hypothetical protein
MLAIPTVHLNGTSAGDLLNAIAAARTAVREAEEAMGRVCPNGRDYYPQGGAAIQEALRQHANRCHSLRAIYNEIGEIAEAIDAQTGEPT